VGESDEPDRRYKVGRVLANYDLRDLHAALPDLWLGDDTDMSLRQIAKRINIDLTRRALERAGEAPLDGEAANAYRLLTADDVSVGVQTQQRSRLERAGINVDELEGDFVTHQAVHSYLTKSLDLSKDDGESRDRTETNRERVQRLQSRLRAVVDQSLADLADADQLSVGTLDSTVNVQVYCQECNTQYDFGDLLNRGGCRCGGED